MSQREETEMSQPEVARGANQRTEGESKRGGAMPNWVDSHGEGNPEGVKLLTFVLSPVMVICVILSLWPSDAVDQRRDPSP